ncbi:MAG: pyridoxamine 5'-phosphate oxidase family protein [Clostridia bacterium]|nr:pyridoxamine 5'-phosphate oxidase family protein [Clostridia bacterium]
MFREMRRKDREVDEARAREILCTEDWGVLSVEGDDGFPYGVPVNYAFVEGKIYIHATNGESHKSDAIRRNEKVCFTVVSRHEIEKEKLTTDYASAVVFGTARIIEEREGKIDAVKKMMSRLAPEMAENVEEHCKGSLKRMIMIEITPIQITGKERR